MTAAGSGTGPLRIVLLGATGFVGSALLRRLAARPAGSVEVRALVRDLRRAPPQAFVVPVEGALPAAPPRALFFEQPFVLVHLATKQIDADGTGFEDVNVRGTARLLEALAPGAPGVSCRGIIHGSSISVYGRGPQEGLTEDAPLRPETPLARSRAEAERLITLAAVLRGASAFLLRPRFILGRGDRHTLPGLLALLGRGVMIGSGEQAFSVIDVDDYGEAIARLAARALARAARGEPLRTPLHVGYARPLRLVEILEALATAFDLPLPRRRIPAWRPALDLLRRIPLAATEALATRLELIALPHHVRVDALAREIGSDITEKDPREALRAAVEAMRTQAGA